MAESEHDADLVALLPWFVNGTLGEEEARRVEALLARSPQARAEVALWTAMQRSARDSHETEVPAELGWRRLRREIRRQAGEGDAGHESAAPRWRRMLGTAAALVVCIQAVLLWQAYDRPGPGITLLEGGRTLEESPGTPAGLDLQVRFRDAAAWQEVALLLNSLDAQILHGPTALGLVTIRLAPGAAGAASVDERLGRLQQSPLVEHVQRLAPR